jgi:hypothetical protein
MKKRPSIHKRTIRTKRGFIERWINPHIAKRPKKNYGIHPDDDPLSEIGVYRIELDRAGNIIPRKKPSVDLSNRGIENITFEQMKRMTRDDEFIPRRIEILPRTRREKDILDELGIRRI